MGGHHQTFMGYAPRGRDSSCPTTPTWTHTPVECTNTSKHPFTHHGVERQGERQEAAVEIQKCTAFLS